VAAADDATALCQAAGDHAEGRAAEQAEVAGDRVGAEEAFEGAGGAGGAAVDQRDRPGSADAVLELQGGAGGDDGSGSAAQAAACLDVEDAGIDVRGAAVRAGGAGVGEGEGARAELGEAGGAGDLVLDRDGRAAGGDGERVIAAVEG